MSKMVIKTRKLNDKALLPTRMTKNSAGFDLFACIEKPKIIYKDGGTLLIPTGLAIQIPEGYEGQIRPRSGLALKYGITVLNAPGTIDSDFFGEVSVLLINHSKEDYIVDTNMRVAQLIITRCESPDFEFAEELEKTDRGEGGFGSTGI